MKIRNTRKDVLIFFLVLAIGLSVSILAQNSNIKEYRKQKAIDFESKIASLTLIIGDTLKNKQDYSDILAKSISEVSEHNSNDIETYKTKAAHLVKRLSNYESFYIHLEDNNGKAALHSLEEVSDLDLKSDILKSLVDLENKPDQFSILIKSEDELHNEMCMVTKIPEHMNSRLIICSSLETLLAKVIERSSEEWQQTHLYTGNRIQGFNHLYTHPNTLSGPVSVGELKAQSNNLILLPYVARYADLEISIAFDPGNDFYKLDSWLDYLPFIFGLTLTLASLYYIRTKSIETRVINHKVKLKTKELEEAKNQLQSQVNKSTALFEKLQESNDELTALTNSVDGILWEGDPKTMRYTYVSEQVERILGFTPEKFTKGNFVIGTLMEGTDRSAISEKMLEDPNSNNSFQMEFSSQRANKEKIWLKGIITRVYKNGKLHRLRGVYIDISKQKIQELKNQEIEAQLRQAQKLESIGQLAAGIAHEINTPAQFVGDNLTFIESSSKDLISYVKDSLQSDSDNISLEKLNSILEDIDFEFLEEELPDAIQQSKEGLDRINRIVGAMKNFSHPDGEEKQKIDLNKAIESTSIISKNEWKYLAEMTLELEDKLPPLSCHPSELNQVFLNIIVNAAHAIEQKYQGSGMGKIKIVTAKQGDNVLISIHDDGCGIPQSILNKIFDPFFTTKGVGKGTGQGLSISYSVIRDKHNGSINIDSDEGKGTVFHIILPLEG
ncbi:PAS domain-containing sensor histidine kinase [Pseudoteredinibacter isoporae]|uniref:histidine kinase n=1 Tax=Pseudoteredinibacter isoporae TaxID=570281 RepID=A0A7X0MUJ2_9GAMM|nr:ATP-binding protein [Pseudoteredinibacter isoporae]MBB6520338.1 PAS domain S-box-containing protein [Pseudoteredinibacter isoporae]NHO85909.1 PAS domain-containing protein [Pseudoteredinibacter isoporae]NIB25639.1 PAS domain-containing protein [Pseudoteredinibacter isoporae]